MKKCKYCQSEIDDKAKICPNCRKKQKGKGKLILIVLAVLIIIGIASSGSEDSNTGKDSSKKNESTAEKTEKVISVSANELYKAYDSNEVKADDTYKDKTLLIEGTIQDIGKDILDDIYITLKTDDLLFNVQCYFSDKEKDKVSELEKDSKITIQGKCDGKLGNVLIKKCIIK